MSKVTVVALRPFRGEEGFVQPKQHLEVEERRAAELAKRGLVTYEVGEVSRAKAQRSAPRNKAQGAAPDNRAAPAADATKSADEATQAAAGGEAAAETDPTETVAARRAGTRTGKGKSRSSSRPARRRGK